MWWREFQFITSLTSCSSIIVNLLMGSLTNALSKKLDRLPQLSSEFHWSVVRALQIFTLPLWIWCSQTVGRLGVSNAIFPWICALFCMFWSSHQFRSLWAETGIMLSHKKDFVVFLFFLLFIFRIQEWPDCLLQIRASRIVFAFFVEKPFFYGVRLIWF